MSPDEIMTVKQSWAKVVPISEQAADLFYMRLFEVYPEVKPYFKGRHAGTGKEADEYDRYGSQQSGRS